MDKQPTDTSELLALVTKNFEESEEASRDERAEAEKARDYFDGNQWSDEEIATLRKRKQPVVTDNKLKDKIEYIVGMEAAGRSDPKAYPREPNDEESAEAATDALRYVADNNDMDTIVSDIFENLLVEGVGGAEVGVERVQRRGKDEIEITITRTPWERTYRDPHSVEKNFSDATYRGSFVWMDTEVCAEKWPDVDWETVNGGMTQSVDDGSTGDRPRTGWISPTRKRVRVVQQWLKIKGKVHQCKFVQGAWVEEPKESPYLDEDGQPEDIYCFMSAYVERDGTRYGLARRYISLQDEVNHRRSRALWLLNTKQIVAEEGAFRDINRARTEANKADGVIEYTPGMSVDIRENNDLAAGQASLLQQASDSLITTSPKVVGGDNNAQSGRAKQLDQQNDKLEMGRVFDQLRALKADIYRKVWNRVRQFWTEEKWIRIRDQDGVPVFAQLNQPVTAADRAQEMMEAGDPNAEAAMMQAQINPLEVVDKRNDVADLDVDIIIDESPDVLTIQHEEFANLVSLSSAGVVFPLEVYIQASSLRNKQQLIEKLKGVDEDNPQAQEQAAKQAQIQEAMVMTELSKQNAEAEEKAAKARKANAEAEEQELTNALGKSATLSLAQE